VTVRRHAVRKAGESSLGRCRGKLPPASGAPRATAVVVSGAVGPNAAGVSANAAASSVQVMGSVAHPCVVS